MKKLFFLASLFSFPFISYAQQQTDISGTWSGTADIMGNNLRIVFNLEYDGSAYTGTMDSPDQGAKGMPLTNVAFESGELTVGIAPLNFIYNGTLESDGSLKGKFSQSGMNFPLDLTKGEPILNRPQEPKPPYPYHSEEVKFENTTDEVTLAGTITVPKGAGKYPAVIIVSGSGPQNRDEEVFGHKPFLVIADHLTRCGIVVLRYDDRGFAQSTGDFAGSTIEGFTRDALAAFDYLLSRNDISPTRIGIIGHSEGGTIAFMAAAQQPEIGFIIPMAGVTLRGDTALVIQNRDIMLQAGYDRELTENYCAVLSEVFRIREKEDVQYIRDNSASILAAIPQYASLTPDLATNMVTVLTTSYPTLDFSLRYDPANDIAKTRCPVFALNGDKDIQVNAAANISRLSEIMDGAGNPNYKTKIYPGLNHMFQECKTGGIGEYGQIEQTISPQVLEDITNWILEITK